MSNTSPKLSTNTNLAQPSKLYVFFRLILATALTILYLASLTTGSHPPSNPAFLIISLSYLTTTLIQSFSTFKNQAGASSTQLFFYILLDQAFILVFLYLNKETNLGIATLLVTPVCMAAVLFKGRTATFFAATATTGLFAVHFFSILYHDKTFQTTTTIGFLGLSFFIASLIIQYLSKRIAETEQQAEQQQHLAEELSLINQEIVQRIRTGIIIINDQDQTMLSNQAAENIFSIKSLDNKELLFNALSHWRITKKNQYSLNLNQQDLRCSFSQLQNSNYTIVFIEDMAEINQRAQQLKLASLGRLTASIAHEIRNPLSAVSYANQLLSDSTSTSLEDAELIATSETNVKRINHIITDILSISKPATISPTKVNLQEFCQTLIEEYQLKNHEIDIHFNLQAQEKNNNSGFLTSFDQSQLRQVLVNLIDNGLRYSAENTDQEKIKLSLSKDDSDCCQLDIIDYGQGIPSKDFSQIFEPFFTTSKLGTGLGLYLTKELCTLNQAQVRLIQKKNPTHGAHFQIKFAHPNRDIASSLETF